MPINYNSSFNGAQPFSDVGISVMLLPNTQALWLVPGTQGQMYRVEFSYAANDYVWVGRNTNPTIPVAGTVNPTNKVEFRPKIRYAQGGDFMLFITSQTGVQFGASIMQLPSPTL